MDAQELADDFSRQVDWRRQKAAEYPDDARNAEAAQILDGLAATASSCPPEVIVAAGELFEDFRDVEVWSEMMRGVGFHYWPANAEVFCRDFIHARVTD